MKPGYRGNVLAGLLAFSLTVCPAMGGSPGSSLEQLAETAQLYLSSGRGYVPGDLLVTSQVKELQAYLRRTRKKSKILHRTLLKRTVHDQSPLAQLFFADGASDILREAAAKLGGYRPLEAVALDSTANSQLHQALSLESVDAVVAVCRQYQASHQDHSGPKNRVARIYTLQDLLQIAAVSPGKSKPASKQP